MNTNQQFLQNLYEAFNNREVESIMPLLKPDVKWANGMEGGFVYGRDAVREYWLNQFKTMQPQLEPLDYQVDEKNRDVVIVRIVIKDLAGDILAETTLRQIFTIENDLISLFEIESSESLGETMQKTKISQ